MTIQKTTYRSLNTVLKYLEAQRNLLVEAGAPADAVNAYSNVLRHLHRLSKSEVELILSGQGKRTKASDIEDQAKQYKSASLKDVEQAVDSEKATRKDLEAILVGRFQYPKGSLKTAGNMEQLRQLIDSMVDNERTHSVIADVAGRDRSRR